MKSKLTVLFIVVMALASFGAPAIAQDMNEVSILYWQASSILNPYLSGGTKDIDASAIVLEPLANWSPDGSLNLLLATEDSHAGKRWHQRRSYFHYLEPAR